MANEIQAAIKILEQEKARIELALNALKGVSDTTTTKRGGWSSSGGKRKKRVMSADARKRIADAQRARWAKQRAKK